MISPPPRRDIRTNAANLVRSFADSWVTDEDPAVLSARKQKMHDFSRRSTSSTARRACAPFFSGLLTGQHV
jgi:hypothetical protein